MTFQKRLKAVMKGGNLRVADLTRWFERPDPTVRGWTRGVQPAGAAADQADILHRLTTLEMMIRRRETFPLEARLSPSKRIAALAKAREQL